MLNPDTIPTDEIKMGDPVWRMAFLFPPQGSWSEAEYLALDAGRQIDFESGFVEVLDLPTKEHQRIVRFLFLLLQAFVESKKLGEVFFAPLPVRLWNQKYREPDLVFLNKSRSESLGYPNGADLVVEVVSSSPTDRKRDLETKVAEYEKAAIPEYWIVDPQDKSVSVYALNSPENATYAVQKFTGGQLVRSKVLAGFEADVSEILAAANAN